MWLLGFLLEILGMAITAFGLWRTWRAYADGEPFWPKWFRNVLTQIKGRFSKPKRRDAYVSVPAAGANAAAHAPDVFGWNELDSEAKLEATRRVALQALQEANEAHAAVRSEERERKAEIAELTSRIDVVKNEMASDVRKIVVEGVPLAAFGLFCVFVGFVLQAAATISG